MPPIPRRGCPGGVALSLSKPALSLLRLRSATLSMSGKAAVRPEPVLSRVEGRSPGGAQSKGALGTQPSRRAGPEPSRRATPPWTCDAYCGVILPGLVRRSPPQAAHPPASWESGHLGRLRAGSPHSWSPVTDRNGAGERGAAESCNVHHPSQRGFSDAFPPDSRSLRNGRVRSVCREGQGGRGVVTPDECATILLINHPQCTR